MKTFGSKPIPSIEVLESRISLDSTAVSHGVAALSVARDATASITVGSQAYFVGGQGLTSAGFSTVDVYDAVTRQWSDGEVPDPGVFKGFAVTGEPLVAGRIGAPGPDHGLVETFNKALGQWSANVGPEVPGPLTTQVGHYILFYGPDSNQSKLAKSVLAYNTISGHWSHLMSPIALDLNASSVSLANKAYFLVDNGSSVLLDQFDANSATWAVIRVPTGTVLGNPISVGGKLVFVGGPRGADSNAVVTFDPATKRWMTSPLSQSRSDVVTAVVGAKVYFIGGSNGNNPSQKSTVVDIYDSTTGTLSAVTCPTTVISPIITLGNKLISASGDVLDTSSGLWSTSPLSAYRIEMGVTTVGIQALFAGGNQLHDNITFNPVNTIDIFTDLSPSPVLSGGLTGNIRERDKVTVINTGDADLPAGYTIQLYASPDRALSGAVLVGSRSVSSSLSAGASSLFNIRTVIPAGTPGGIYHLLAAVQDGTGNITPIAAEDATFRVRGVHAAAARPSVARRFSGVFATGAAATRAQIVGR